MFQRTKDQERKLLEIAKAAYFAKGGTVTQCPEGKAKGLTKEYIQNRQSVWSQGRKQVSTAEFV